MPLQEKYKRPSFAQYSENQKRGVIIFTDGRQSDDISSIPEGKRILRDLVSSGMISTDDGNRIEDQLNCSDLPMNVQLTIGILMTSGHCSSGPSDEHRANPIWN